MPIKSLSSEITVQNLLSTREYEIEVYRDLIRPKRPRLSFSDIIGRLKSKFASLRIPLGEIKNQSPLTDSSVVYFGYSRDDKLILHNKGTKEGIIKLKFFNEHGVFIPFLENSKFHESGFLENGLFVIKLLPDQAVSCDLNALLSELNQKVGTLRILPETNKIAVLQLIDNTYFIKPVLLKDRKPDLYYGAVYAQTPSKNDSITCKS